VKASDSSTGCTRGSGVLKQS